MPHAPSPLPGLITRQPLASPIIAFVEATDKIFTDGNEEFIFGDMELGHEQLPVANYVDSELVDEVVGEIATIRGNSGVGSPEVAKYVDAWQPLHNEKADVLRSLAEQLYQRRPVLYLQGHPEPLPASVLLRTVQKPSVSAITRGATTAAGLFKFPSNSFIVIKFDPKFGYADIIVDPFFTDAFTQQPATATYNKLLASLPPAFVGTAAELRKVVALLTQQSILAYASMGATCPPWRRFDAMLARWMPKKFDDEPITFGPGGAAAAATAAAAAAAAPGSPVNFPLAPLRSKSSASSDMTFSLSSSSFSSSGSSSVPKTVVHGFDIPSKPVSVEAAAPQLAPTAAAAAAGQVLPLASTTAVLAPVHAAAAAADTPLAVSKQQQVADASSSTAASKNGPRDSSGLLLLPSSLPASADSSSQWQLAAVHVQPTATAAAEDESDDGDMAIFTANSLSEAVITTELAHAVTSKEAAAQSAKKHLLSDNVPAIRAATAADVSAQLLAANGYSSIRVVKMMGPTAAADATATTGAAATAAGGGGAGWPQGCGVAAIVPRKPRAVSCSGAKPNYKTQGVEGDENNFFTVKLPVPEACKGVKRPLDFTADFMLDRAPLHKLKSASLGNTFSLKDKDRQVEGLSAMVARIREAAERAAAAAVAAPAGVGKVVHGRRVVRLSCNGADVVELESLQPDRIMVHGALAA